MSDADNPLTQHNCDLLPMSFHCQQKTKDSFHQLDLWNKPMRHALPECDKTLGAYLTTCEICVAHFKKREMNFHFEKKISITLFIIIMNFLLKVSSHYLPISPRTVHASDSTALTFVSPHASLMFFTHIKISHTSFSWRFPNFLWGFFFK